MNLKKLLSVLLCLLIGVSGLAFAEEDKDARIAELEKQVAELAQQVEAYHLKELVAQYDGGEILLTDAQEQYAYLESMYQQYGITSFADYGMEETMQQQVVIDLAERAILMTMADKLDITVADDARISFEEEASASYESMVQYYYENSFKANYEDETEGLTATAQFLNEQGYTYEALLDSQIDSYLRDEVYNFAVKDVQISEEDIQATFDELVKADEETYASNASSYESARSGAAAIYWNPSDYREVKHILFKFDDDQSQRYSELVTQLESLKSELVEATEPEDAADEPAPVESDSAESTPAESTPAESEPTELPVARAASEIEADIASINEQLDALYAELMPEVDAALTRYNDGEDISALIAELNDDTGMPEIGYAVSTTADASTQAWDTAFTAGALSIAEVGEMSEPVRGFYGIHLIYYVADIPAGAVTLESVREVVEATASETKLSETYTAQLDAWKEELNLTLYLENF